MNGSSVSLFRVIRRLQCWQFNWLPSRTLFARARKTLVHDGHLIFTLSSIMSSPDNGYSPMQSTTNALKKNVKFAFRKTDEALPTRQRRS